MSFITGSRRTSAPAGTPKTPSFGASKGVRSNNTSNQPQRASSYIPVPVRRRDTTASTPRLASYSIRSDELQSNQALQPVPRLPSATTTPTRVSHKFTSGIPTPPSTVKAKVQDQTTPIKLETPKPSNGRKFSSTIRSIFTPKSRSSIISASPTSPSRKSTDHDRVASLQAQNVELEAQADISRQKDQEAQKEREELSYRLRVAEERLQRSKKENENAQERVKRVEAENSGLREQIAKKNEEVARLEGLVQQKEVVIKEQDAKIEELALEKEGAKAQLAKAQELELAAVAQEHEKKIAIMASKHQGEVQRMEDQAKKEYRALEKEFKTYKKTALEKHRESEEEWKMIVEKKEVEVREEMTGEAKKVVEEKDIQCGKIVTGYEMKLEEAQKKCLDEQEVVERLEKELAQKEEEMKQLKELKENQDMDREELLREQLEEAIEKAETVMGDLGVAKKDNAELTDLVEELCEMVEDKDSEMEELQKSLAVETQKELKRMEDKCEKRLDRCRKSNDILQDRNLEYYREMEHTAKMSRRLADVAHAQNEEIAEIQEKHLDEVEWFVEVIEELGKEKEMSAARIGVLEQEKENLEWELTELAKITAFHCKLGEHFGDEDGSSMDLEEVAAEAWRNFEPERIAQLAAGVFVSRSKPSDEEEDEEEEFVKGEDIEREVEKELLSAWENDIEECFRVLGLSERI